MIMRFKELFNELCLEFAGEMLQEITLQDQFEPSAGAVCDHPECLQCFNQTLGRSQLTRSWKPPADGLSFLLSAHDGMKRLAN